MRAFIVSATKIRNVKVFCNNIVDFLRLMT